MSQEVETLTKKSRLNSGEIRPGVKCGCYFGISVGDGAEIDEWTDDGKTAICPRCGVDSLVAGITNLVFLMEANEYWFTAVYDGKEQ